MTTKRQRLIERAKSANRSVMKATPKKARGSVARSLRASMKIAAKGAKKASPKKAARKGKVLRRYTKVWCDVKLVPHFRRVAVRKKMSMATAAA